MEISKSFLNDMLQRKGYVEIIEKNLHSGPHFTMVFPMDKKLYMAYYVEDRSGTPKWLSEPNTSSAACTEVKKQVVKHTYYVEVEDDAPLTTPPSLDYRI